MFYEDEENSGNSVQTTERQIESKVCPLKGSFVREWKTVLIASKKRYETTRRRLHR
jgi:hypothetical protein